MSRPFSYNDEIFTVIGNVLFVHFKYEDSAEIGTRLIEIPPAISDRLLFLSNMFIVAYDKKNSNCSQTVVTIIDYNGKSYLTNKAKFSAAKGKYFFGIYMLKDI